MSRWGEGGNGRLSNGEEAGDVCVESYHVAKARDRGPEKPRAMG